MSQYSPEDIWTFEGEQDGKFGSINRPTAGARYVKQSAVGQHPFQLYSLGTPNGVKVTIMFEELLLKGHKEAEYDAHLINIMNGDQFGSGFVEINPNSKIPALYDVAADQRIFESGSILLYLAERFNEFIPKSLKEKTETMNWLFWQMASAPYLGGGFGHFYSYAPVKIKYAIDRFAMEVKRQLDVLDQHLSENEYFSGAEYSIADMAIWPWYGALIQGHLYDAAEFLQVHTYKHLVRWAELVGQREAVKKGRVVNRTWGEADQQLAERHSDEDFKGINF